MRLAHAGSSRIQLPHVIHCIPAMRELHGERPHAPKAAKHLLELKM